MKYFDEVKVLVDKPQYAAKGVHKGDIGKIYTPELRDTAFDVVFEVEDEYEPYKQCFVELTDLEMVKPGNVTDNQLLIYLPKHDPRWWCKVENGYILNLKGERKNKIPYDYDS